MAIIHITHCNEHTHTLYLFMEVGDFLLENAQQSQVTYVPNITLLELQPIPLYRQHSRECHYLQPVVMSTTMKKCTKKT